MAWAADAPAPRGAMPVTATRPIPGAAYTPRPMTGMTREVCRCWAATYLPSRPSDPDRPYCPGAYGAADEACRRYVDDCAALLACARREPVPATSPPTERR